MRGKVRTHHRLARVADRQHGVIARGQLRELGYSDASIDRAATSGRLHRVHRGVYAVGHSRLSNHGQCQAAVLACGPRALLSHRSAAWLWGLRARPVAPVEVARPSRGHRRPGLHIHHLPLLREEDRAESEGLPVTAVPRTLLDLASTEPQMGLERALDRAERLGLLDLGGIDRLLAGAGKHSGITKLRSALEPHREPAFTRSWLERRFLALVRDANLPMPSANVFVEGFEIDMYWERERFAVELDGYEHHRGRSSFERDRRRQEELKLAGIEMIRFTARRIVDQPAEAIQRVAMLLDRRRLELDGRAGPDPGR